MLTEGCSPTCQGVLSVPKALDDHPGVIFLEAGWTLEIGLTVLQHIVVNLAVLIGHAPHQRHTVIGHQGLRQVNDGGTWHYQGPGRRSVSEPLEELGPPGVRVELSLFLPGNYHLKLFQNFLPTGGVAFFGTPPHSSPPQTSSSLEGEFSWDLQGRDLPGHRESKTPVSTEPRYAWLGLG